MLTTLLKFSDAEAVKKKGVQLKMRPWESSLRSNKQKTRLSSGFICYTFWLLCWRLICSCGFFSEM